MAFIFHSIWNNKPNWRTHIFQRGWLNHQPAKKLLGIYKVIKYWSSVSVENPNHMMSFPKDCLGVSSETYWNILKRTETYWNILKHAETCWNMLKHTETPWIFDECVSTMNIMNIFGNDTMWHPERFETIEDSSHVWRRFRSNAGWWTSMKLNRQLKPGGQHLDACLITPDYCHPPKMVCLKIWHLNIIFPNKMAEYLGGFYWYLYPILKHTALHFGKSQAALSSLASLLKVGFLRWWAPTALPVTKWDCNLVQMSVPHWGRKLMKIAIVLKHTFLPETGNLWQNSRGMTFLSLTNVTGDALKQHEVLVAPSISAEVWLPGMLQMMFASFPGVQLLYNYHPVIKHGWNFPLIDFPIHSN